MKQWGKDIFNKFWPGLADTAKIGERQAKKLVTDFLKDSIREAKQDGTFNLPLNYGNILLKEEKEGSKSLKPEREEGVTDKDILWYYNIHEVERRMLDKIDIFFRLALYEEYISNGLSKNEAVKKLFKFRPKWGNPRDTKHTSGYDRPLPPSLMDRVNRYIIKRSETDIGKFKLDCEQSSSLNALIRKEIKRENI
ncbi:MAG: hypothetical protein E3J83_01755 [Candidatus Atribacteria bacterium]|nr:MAG: hypothetical protein E3J83_01755 [Candidatus Atribacteria bacterium]